MGTINNGFGGQLDHGGFVEVLAVLEQPSKRRKKHGSPEIDSNILTAETARLRLILIHWLQDTQYWDEVEVVGEANPFHVLTIRCSQRVANALHEAPGVKTVSPGGTSLDLIQ